MKICTYKLRPGFLDFQYYFILEKGFLLNKKNDNNNKKA